MKIAMYRGSIPLFVALAALGLSPLAGCGGNNQSIEQVPVVPVTTKVLFEGQPLEGAFVVLHPKTDVNPKAIAAQGYVDKEGVLKPTTYTKDDGAAIGEFAVTVELRRPTETADGPTLGPNLLPERYANRHTTDLVIKVAKGQTEVEPLNLTR